MTTTITRSVPAEVRAAFLFWMGALAAGVAEMIQQGGGMPGVAVRLGIYAVVVFVALRMRAGHNWARLTLAIGLGVLGTLSLVIEPISLLLDGHPVGDALSVARIVHVLCVWIAVPLMFTRAARAWFRS